MRRKKSSNVASSWFDARLNMKFVSLIVCKAFTVENTFGYIVTLA